MPNKTQSPTTVQSAYNAQKTQLAQQNIAAAELKTTNAGTVLAKANRPGTKRHQTGAEFILSRALSYAARKFAAFQYVDAYQASQLFAEQEQVQQQIEAIADKEGPDEERLVIFAKQGVHREMFTVERFFETINKSTLSGNDKDELVDMLGCALDRYNNKTLLSRAQDADKNNCYPPRVAVSAPVADGLVF